MSRVKEQKTGTQKKQANWMQEIKKCKFSFFFVPCLKFEKKKRKKLHVVKAAPFLFLCRHSCRHSFPKKKEKELKEFALKSVKQAAYSWETIFAPAVTERTKRTSTALNSSPPKHGFFSILLELFQQMSKIEF